MHACMHACMHTCMNATIYVCMCLCMHACMYVCMYVYMYVRMYVCGYVCISQDYPYVQIPTHVYMCIYTYIYIYICVCVCVRTQMFTYLNQKCLYIYIYEPDTFRVYITAICCLQYKMESKMDPVGINPLLRHAPKSFRPFWIFLSNVELHTFDHVPVELGMCR